MKPRILAAPVVAACFLFATAAGGAFIAEMNGGYVPCYRCSNVPPFGNVCTGDNTTDCYDDDGDGQCDRTVVRPVACQPIG